MVCIVRGAYRKPVLSEKLINYFEKRKDIEGYLFLGYPIIASSEGAIHIDAMLVSQNYGLIVFDIDQGNTFEDKTKLQDDIYRKVNSKLLQYKDLVSRRTLAVNVEVVTFATNWKVEEKIDFHLIQNETELDKFLINQKWNENARYPALLSAIQAISTIRAKIKRDYVKKLDSKGAKLSSCQ